MTLHIVFDDTLPLSAALRSLVGVEKFGSLVFQRRSRLEYMRTAAEEAGARLINLDTAADQRALRDRIRDSASSDDTYLYCPSHLVPRVARDSVITFLRQIAYSPVSVHVPLNGQGDRRGWTLLPSQQFSAFLSKVSEGDVGGFFDANKGSMVDVRDRLPLIDITEERTLLDFMSGQFEVRHFNSIARGDFTVTKRSTDRAKLKREFNYYRLMPPNLQMFLVQPFNFKDDGDAASYEMERISVPDMALQWVHGALTADEFRKFLAHIFHFIAQRPARTVDRDQAHAAQKALYIDKVTSRIDALKKAPEYARLEPLFASAFGGVDKLVARYMRLHAKLEGRFDRDRLVAGHGDPCFSNILYSKSNQFLKLIDPRGADNEDDVYTDAYYDMAKLSHSILGNYDFLNLGKFDLVVSDTLDMRLGVQAPPEPWAAAMFYEFLADAGFDARLTRLCEASLFISMLPLHIDRPRNVLAFGINADAILTELETWKDRRP